MEIFATIVMLVWIPTVLVLFLVMPPQRAVIVAFVGAWLFLPVISYKLPFLPDYTKSSATCAGVFLSALLFDSRRILRFVPRWVDVPVVILCTSPLVTSLVNGLGLWDGTSGMLEKTVSWGLPYFIGRIYFNDSKSIRELAVGIFTGGLLYVPLCVFEMRMSPQLHKMIYGFDARGVQMRFGGWRPAVFMDGGLAVGLWMTGASLVGIWLWRMGVLKRLWGASMSWLGAVLFITTVLCRSAGALAFLFGSLGALWFTSQTKTRLALVCTILLAPTYIAVRTTGLWHGEELIALAEQMSKDRADSLQFRIKNEDILVAKALQQPIFGWGGWGARVFTMMRGRTFR